jgi:hypothetical protein
VIADEDTKKNVSWVTTSTPLELPTTWVDLEQGLAKCCSDIEATEDVLRAVKAYAPKPNQRVVAVRSDYDGFHARLASAASRQGDLSTEMCLAIASHNLRPLVQGWFADDIVNAWLQADQPSLSDLFAQAENVQKGAGQVFRRKQEFKSFFAGGAGSSSANRRFPGQPRSAGLVLSVRLSLQETRLPRLRWPTTGAQRWW